MVNINLKEKYINDFIPYTNPNKTCCICFCDKTILKKNTHDQNDIDDINIYDIEKFWFENRQIDFDFF